VSTTGTKLQERLSEQRTIALANRDGTFHPAEKVFVRHVAGQVGFPAADLDALLA
jgi:hypothetical protein